MGCANKNKVTITSLVRVFFMLVSFIYFSCMHLCSRGPGPVRTKPSLFVWVLNHASVFPLLGVCSLFLAAGTATVHALHNLNTQRGFNYSSIEGILFECK